MYDANEIGLNWKGTLESLSIVPYAKCLVLPDTRVIKDHTGKPRCHLQIEETIADGTIGKLVWAKRYDGSKQVDVLIKKPVSQKHSKQEAVIQWLVNKTLSAYNLGRHCPKIIDVFSFSKSIWFSMEPVYSAPILDTYMKSLPYWNTPDIENGLKLLQVLAQVAMSCFVLEQEIGFNHRDLKPDNILVKLDSVKPHILRWKDSLEIKVSSSPTAIVVDFGFSCLGPGKAAWIQSGDGVLPPFDSCPKVGRDIFMILVFLLWRKDVRNSLTEKYLDFFKKSLRLSTDKLVQMMHMNRNPSEWVYILITDRSFKCPALDPLEWLKTCALEFPEIVTILDKQSSS